MSAAESMSFRRYGQSCHLEVKSTEDLRKVLELDEAHWAAMGSPIETLNCDPVFLELVDTDENGIIICTEMKDAIRWLDDVLTDQTGVNEASDSLVLEALNADSPDGRSIREAARKILNQSDDPDADVLTLEQVREVKRKTESTPVSEAGVVLTEATDDEDTRAFLEDILATVGGAPHPSGVDGVGQEQLDAFLEGAQAYLDWKAQGEIPKGRKTTDNMPLGEETPAAFAEYAALSCKIDQYFAQCRAIQLDERLASHIGPDEDQLTAVDFADPEAIEAMMKGSPLAELNPERVLRFSGKVNPVYAASLEKFRASTAAPVLGDSVEELTEDDWKTVKSTLAEHQAWLDAKPPASVDSLSEERLRECLTDKYRYAVEALISESGNTAFVLDNIRLTEKLILYQVHLLRLANNFISFPDLYDKNRRALFEMGTLIMDGRRLNMVVKVQNRAEHKKVARNSLMFVCYVELIARKDGEKFEAAVPVTFGGKGNLCVGKRGLFVDLEDNEYSARIIEIIENPISLGEALISPFQRIGRAIGGKIESITSQAEKKLDQSATAAVTKVQSTAPAAGKPTGAMAGGLLTGGGVALAAR